MARPVDRPLFAYKIATYVHGAVAARFQYSIDLKLRERFMVEFNIADVTPETDLSSMKSH
jgi:hypothetical protein